MHHLLETFFAHIDQCDRTQFLIVNIVNIRVEASHDILAKEKL